MTNGRNSSSSQPNSPTPIVPPSSGISGLAEVRSLLDVIHVDDRQGLPESLHGAVAVPLAVGGPISLDGKFASGSFLIPLATTEQGLVAGINRGAKAIRESGGCTSRVFYDGIVRAPLFSCRDVQAMLEALSWINKHTETLAEIAGHGSRFTELIEVLPIPTGSFLHVRLAFQTGDAMGMSMATRAAERIAAAIANNTGASLLTVSGNLCADKKALCWKCTPRKRKGRHR